MQPPFTRTAIISKIIADVQHAARLNAESNAKHLDVECWMLATARSGTLRDFSTSLEMTRSPARRWVGCRIKCGAGSAFEV